MQINDSALSLTSSYSRVSYTEVREHLEITRPGQSRPDGADVPADGARRRPGSPWDAVVERFGAARDRAAVAGNRRARDDARSRGIAPKGASGLDGPRRPKRSCHCGAAHHDSSNLDSIKDPKLRSALDLIERLTGMHFDILDTEDFARRLEAAGTGPEVPTGGGAVDDLARARQPTITYDRIETRVESQSLRVAARARVTTGDGREISVDLALRMDRMFAERSETHVRIGPPLKDPLVLDLGTAPESIDGSRRAAFDLDADGNLDEVPWVSGSTAFLALDRDGNGVIDDGSELFGTRTGDGFAELAALDDDRDGWIDEDDAAWSQLRLVTAAPSDGTVAVADTRSLADAGVGAIAVSSVVAPLTERDASGDVVAEQRDVGVYLRESGTAGTIRQVDLAF